MSSLNVQQLGGTGTLPEILQGFVYVAALFTILYSIEGMVKLYASYSTARIVLVDNTLDSKKAKIIRQLPSKPQQLILPSDNQLTGVEFTYTFFLYINPESINTTETSGVLRQVFYKGYTNRPFPLVGPGVFLHANTNTMRVMMNSYKNWLCYTDIENLPISKWIHVALVFRKNNLEIYVNGNIAGRIAMENTFPYQNFQDLIIFGNNGYNSDTKRFVPLGKSASSEEKVHIKGAISGQLSRVYYYRYALSYFEIQGLAAKGPSTTMEGGADEFEKVPLGETWYTTGIPR